MSVNISCKKYNSIDILKLTLAILVMVIHSGVDKTVISPLLRCAVPLFFIISSYFFFSKNKNLTSDKEKNRALRKLIKRNLLLYFIWSLIQLPVLFFMRGYHHELPQSIWYAARDILNGSGFTGAWYIVAFVIGVVVIFGLSKKIPAKWLVILTLPLYAISCFATNYYNLLEDGSFIISIADRYNELTGLYFYTSFPVALFWISTGRFIAEKKFVIKNNMMVFFAGLFAVLLGLERYFAVKYELGVTDDCYFMLILFCPLIFMLVRSIEGSFSTRLKIRELSVVLYVVHGCCGRIIGYILKQIPVAFLNGGFVKMVITVVIAIAATELIVYLKEHTNIKIFNYFC